MYMRRKVDWQNLLSIALLLMAVPIILASYRTNFQPWYLLYALPFIALSSNKYYVFIPGVIFSMFALLQYVPFLYSGNWDPPIPTILNGLNIIAIVFSIVFVFFYSQFRYKENKIKK